ncbi:MAG: sigma-54-dependent Fis family transcriptional regulator [Lentisphaerae bacterium]|nr:sigma-54-dependent Fis family transcriptional regulator [Lentisphaerota bacterium]MBT4816336.1 sigma-54-dependent Fis family transcriptional regulator [Lentisphaerota bacterium]MBT5608847.1 sigma-54-dependent Fis family transcriptional regulator [Lentisphaerota bacterium]MBT7058739.1 sigma-54-dependent Fis family transcriptional regulator [Lentisphaerota bacterium]MBT7845054.1 sigma-54-dependent Fis family transcriptional regulator [Lentisphaerota bacterium]
MRRSKGTVLVVDDEESFRENVAEYLQSRGYQVLQAPDADSGMTVARTQSIDVAAVDMVMPGAGGIEFLESVKEVDPFIQVVIMTGQGSIETAVDAMRRGAFEYVSKPTRLAELEAVIRRALANVSLARENRAYREAQRRGRLRLAGRIVAKSPAMRRILAESEHLGQTDFTVLIQGETGTGKEVVANYIHANSTRCDLPMTVLNCAAIPDHLVDSELFGHEKGAFTGADETRPGMIAVADRGTLLLDEIGDMPEQAQSRLLRVLENGVYRRIGGRTEHPVDVRILAATNHDLTADVENGTFREDLYHRLNVYQLTVPPLRERPDDVLAVAESVLHSQNRKAGTELALSKEARDALSHHAWPGNVRELSHAIERAAFSARMASAEEISADHLGLPRAKPPAGVQVSLAVAEARHIQAVLRSVGGSKREAAKVLEISERHLYRLLSSL